MLCNGRFLLGEQGEENALRTQNRVEASGFGRRTAVLTIFSVAIGGDGRAVCADYHFRDAEKLVTSLVGALPHVTIKPADPLPEPMASLVPAGDRAGMVVSYQQPRLQQRNDIEQWEGLVEKISAYPGVRVAAANVSGSAFLIRGSKQRAVSISAALPPKWSRSRP